MNVFLRFQQAIKNNYFVFPLIGSLFIFFFLIKSNVVFAQATPYPWEQGEDAEQYYIKGFEECGRGALNISCYLTEASFWALGSLVGTFSPTGSPPNVFATDFDLSGMFARNGAPGYLANTMALLYQNPPTGKFDQYMASLGLSKPAYAQGSKVLSLTLNLWRMVRNIVYIMAIIVLVVLGLMIMFRTKIDPRTVISVYNSLPNLVISLVLITFSYAIAGLMWDGFQVVNSLAFNALNILNANPDIAGAPHNCPQYSPNTLPVYPCKFTAIDVVGVFGIGYGLFTTFSSNITYGLPLGGSGISMLPASLNIGWLINLVMSFAIFGSGIKLLFALIPQYAKFFINTITAPGIILLSALPGQRERLTGWFKGYLAIILSFTGVFLAMNVAYYFMLAAKAAPTPTSVTNLAVPELLNNFSTAGIPIIIAYGIVLALPAIPAAVDDALKTGASPAISRATQDIGQNVKKIPIIGGALSTFT